jgi:hypothetical protein
MLLPEESFVDPKKDMLNSLPEASGTKKMAVSLSIHPLVTIDQQQCMRLHVVFRARRKGMQAVVA